MPCDFGQPVGGRLQEIDPLRHRRTIQFATLYDFSSRHMSLPFSLAQDRICPPDQAMYDALPCTS
jgi:hypothetical protein